MPSLQYFICFIVSLFFMAGCTTMSIVQSLPPGSTVAVISSLDNRINYEYIGSTSYMNAAYQYQAAGFDPNESFIPAIRLSLSRSGYQVETYHVSPTSPLTSQFALSSSLSSSQLTYLRKLLKGRHVDRVIILSKGPVNDINHLNEHLFGYGYLKRDGLVYDGTQVYGALYIRVIDMDGLQVFTQAITSIGKQVNNDLFATSALDIHQRSVRYFEQWLHATFAPSAMDSMHRSKILTH